MKIVKPSCSVIRNDCTPYEFIEKIGRTCYKSTDKITPGSAEKFVKNLIKNGHWAMIEHYSVYFVLKGFNNYQNLIDELQIIGVGTQFLRISEMAKDSFIVSGNLRAFHDAFKLLEAADDKFKTSLLLNFYDLLIREFPDVYEDIIVSHIRPEAEVSLWMIDREELIHTFSYAPEAISKHLTHTALFVCDRGVSHEFVRHRPCSFAQESTRYCNYSQSKFGSEIAVIEPFFFKDKEPSDEYNIWKVAMQDAEQHYFELLSHGASPQEARSVLPNSLKTEIIITATEQEWQHIVNLRAKGTTGKPHPQMVEVMMPWYEELKVITDGRVS